MNFFAAFASSRDPDHRHAQTLRRDDQPPDFHLRHRKFQDHLQGRADIGRVIRIELDGLRHRGHADDVAVSIKDRSAA